MFNLFKLQTYAGLQDSYSVNPNLKFIIGNPGEKAVVTETIVGPHQKGRVRFRGSWWSARCLEEAVIMAGEAVVVVGISQITLIVEPIGGFSTDMSSG